MAQLIPATPIAGSSPELIRRLPALHGAGPDFCLVQAERALLLAVSAATPQDVQRMQQMDLFGTAVEPVGVAEESRLSAFMAGR